MKGLKMFILGSIFLLSTLASAQIMGKNVMGSRGRRGKFPGNDRKFGKPSDGQVGQAVREVIIKAMCNYSTNPNITINTTGTEFNTTTANGSNSCEQCFLSTPLSEIFSENGSQVASICTEMFLPFRFQPCAVGISYGNSSSEETAECYKDALKNSTIEVCSNTTNSSDPVEIFQVVASCLRRNQRDFKKEVRMAMMDRVIGGKGCSFSAMIALKLFGDKKRSGLKKDMDFEDALDEMLTDELEEDDLEKPFQWTKDRPKRGGNKKQGGSSRRNKGNQNRGRNSNQYNRGNGGRQRFGQDNVGRGQASGVRGQSNGARGQASGGRNQGSGGRNQGDEYDYDNYDGGSNQASGGRVQTNQGRGQSSGGRGQSNGVRGQQNGGRNQSRGGKRGQGKGGRGNNQGGGRFGGNGNQGGGQPDTNYDEYNYGNGGDDYDYNGNDENQDYDYNQGGEF